MTSTSTTTTTGSLIFSGVLLALVAAFKCNISSSSHSIPRVGPVGTLGYLRTLFRSVLESRQLVNEGLAQFGGGPFILPSMTGECVVLGPQHVAEVRKADERILSAEVRNDDIFQPRVLFAGLDTNAHHFLILLMRSALPRSYTTLVPELVDEAQHVVPYAFDTDTNYPLWESVVHLVARVANRAIIGVPGCRDEAFLALQVAVAEQAIPVAQVLRWFPVVCRPFVWSVFSALAGSRESCLAKLMPYVQQRVVDSGKEDPATVLDLLLKHAPESELSDLRTLALRVTHLNMAAIHTSSIFLTHSLFEIARLPAPQLALLRQEMDDAVAAEGGICSKAALSNFHLLDSLLKEVGRYHMQVSVGSSRMVMQPITLSDGTLLPAGCAVSLAHEPIHFDTKTYPDPYTFKPFRFAHLRTADGDTTSNVKHTFTHLANEYIVFGTGPRACPGRFFASLTIKILVYEILREFDLAFPDGASTQPQPFAFNGFILPNQKATLRFVKRDMK